MQPSYVQKQLVYWFQNQAAGAAFDVQAGPGALTTAIAASVYTITMPANFTVPVNRRQVVLTARGSANGSHFIAVYQETGAGALASNIIYSTFSAASAAAPTAANVGVIGEIYRIESQLGSAASPAG